MGSRAQNTGKSKEQSDSTDQTLVLDYGTLGNGGGAHQFCGENNDENKPLLHLLGSNKRRYQQLYHQKMEHQRQNRILIACVILLVIAICCWPLVLTTLSSDGSSSPSQGICNNLWCPPWATRRGRQKTRFESNSNHIMNPSEVRDFSTTTEHVEVSKHLKGSSSEPADTELKQISIDSSERKSFIHVKSPSPAFPSYTDYSGKPYQVTYNRQSLILNNTTKAVFIGGSMHPSRAAAKESWERALDEAVHNGLNLVTMYVFWSAHQPFANEPIDWSLPYSQKLQSTSKNELGWNLAEAIQSCGQRGLFVHVRIGPYTCAEYSFGGLPEWIPVLYPNITMRRMDPVWLQLMENFVTNATAYLTQHKLWAHQGGPILMAQIENELGSENGAFMEAANEQTSEIGSSSLENLQSKPSLTELQDYADWCGDLVERVAPSQILWTMCNGLSANNTIDSYNGDWGAISWLETHGDNGRVQISTPPLWTEDEQGFQIWGETPEKPSDYFWGIKATDAAKNALRWIARGGFHLNYYMWWGGYNLSREAASGIMNAYATDAVLCPSGERRQPKFGHLTNLHEVIASIAPLLVVSSDPIVPQPVDVLNNDDGSWSKGSDQVAFVYFDEGIKDSETPKEAIFVENNGKDAITVRVSRTINRDTTDDEKIILNMEPYSAIILVDGVVAFGSATLGPETTSFQRVNLFNFVPLLDWSSWQEVPVSIKYSKQCHDFSAISTMPIEQTKLLHQQDPMWTDYVWYSTELELFAGFEEGGMLEIEGQKGMTLVLFINGRYQGTAANFEHSEGRYTFTIPIEPLGEGVHQISILSESLGYHNLVGRWGGGVGPKPKGITGDVTLITESTNHSLVDGRAWCSVGGLEGEHRLLNALQDENEGKDRNWRHPLLLPSYERHHGPRWTSTYFDTPLFDSVDERLYLSITRGRGHIYLNGHDMGRYWNITRADPESNPSDQESPPVYSQRFYHLPVELLDTDGNLNELLILNVFGQDSMRDGAVVQLVLGWVDPSSSTSFKDEVGYPDSCLIT